MDKSIKISGAETEQIRKPIHNQQGLGYQISAIENSHSNEHSNNPNRVTFRKSYYSWTLAVLHVIYLSVRIQNSHHSLTWVNLTPLCEAKLLEVVVVLDDEASEVPEADVKLLRPPAVDCPASRSSALSNGANGISHLTKTTNFSVVWNNLNSSSDLNHTVN